MKKKNNSLSGFSLSSPPQQVTGTLQQQLEDIIFTHLSSNNIHLKRDKGQVVFVFLFFLFFPSSPNLSPVCRHKGIVIHHLVQSFLDLLHILLLHQHVVIIKVLDNEVHFLIKVQQELLNGGITKE
jgi:hypothetical protein